MENMFSKTYFSIRFASRFSHKANSRISYSTEREAKRNLRRSDKARASYYRHISGKRWGDPKEYKLLIDSSKGVEQSAEEILVYLRQRFPSTGFPRHGI